jgi:hypothetical protein
MSRRSAVQSRVGAITVKELTYIFYYTLMQVQYKSIMSNNTTCEENVSITHSNDSHGYARPKLSLLNPDDIPCVGYSSNDRHSRKSDSVASGVLSTSLPRSEKPNSETQSYNHYISPPTNTASDTTIPFSLTDTGTSSSTNTESTSSSKDTHYSSSQLHYYRNREKILAYAKLRYKNNRESLLAYSKQYQNERKTMVKERNVNYYEANRERLLKDRATKITCECGKVIAKGSLSNHLRTKYHLSRVTPKSDETTS